MNGKKVEQFPDEVKEFQAQGHEFSSECYEHEYAFMYTREEEQPRWTLQPPKHGKTLSA